MTSVAVGPDSATEFQDDSDPQSPEAVTVATQTPKRPTRRKATGVIPSYSAVKTMSTIHSVVANGADLISRGLVQLWRLFQPRFTFSWHLYKCCADRLYSDTNKVTVVDDGVLVRFKMCDLCAVANMAMTDIYRDNFQTEKKKP